MIIIGKAKCSEFNKVYHNAEINFHMFIHYYLISFGWFMCCQLVKLHFGMMWII